MRNLIALLLGLALSVGVAILLGSVVGLSLTTSILIGAVGIAVTVIVLVMGQRAGKSARAAGESAGLLDKSSTKRTSFLFAVLWVVWGGVQLFKDSPSPPAIAYFAAAAVFLVIGLVVTMRLRRSNAAGKAPHD